MSTFQRFMSWRAHCDRCMANGSQPLPYAVYMATIDTAVGIVAIVESAS